MELKNYDEVSMPTGVKRIKKFIEKGKRNSFTTTGKRAVITPHKKGTPVHVKAAWIYNDLLKYWGLNNFEQIKSSEKIKWIYLKPNTIKKILLIPHLLLIGFH